MSLPPAQNEIERSIYRRLAEELLAASERQAPAAESTWLDDFHAGNPDIVPIAMIAEQHGYHVDTIKRWLVSDDTLGGQACRRGGALHWYASLRRIKLSGRVKS